MKIAFVDLRAQHDEVRSELESAIRDIIDQSAFIGGRQVEGFEQEFGAFCGVKECVGVGSGTDALRIALQAVGVAQGDAVVTVAHTFIATAEAVSQAGALPLFIDIDPVSYTMSPITLERFLVEECTSDGDGRSIHRASGRRIAAALPVHLYGQPADMSAICRLARRHGLRVVEDAAQAHGAQYRHNNVARSCGTLGDVAGFSFYPGKNLGAMGEAGAVTTDDARVAAAARVLRDHGQSARYIHTRPDGSNARLDALQAAVLRIKLRKLEEWNERRREVAAWYRDLLADADVTVPAEMPYARHIYHLYVIRCSNRDAVAEQLRKADIGVGFHYPVPLHRQEAYAFLGIGEGSLPVTEAVAASIVSLPMHPHMTHDAVGAVAEQVRRVARR